MTNKYNPKTICPKCEHEIWDFDEDIDEIMCKKSILCRSEGGSIIRKKLHEIIGACIYKDKEGRYVLSFPEFNELDLFADWEALRLELDRLVKNEEINALNGGGKII